MAKAREETRRELKVHRPLQNAYVQGAAAPALDFPVRDTEPERGRTPVAGSPLRDESRTQMNMGYLLFLAAMAVAVVTVCVNYLQLRARYTNLQKEYTVLEADLSERILENDAIYNGIVSSINLEEVKETATQKLGMVYATGEQIITYTETEKDYVKQYRDIP